MHAVAVADFGARPEVTHLPVPQPGPGEVLLRIQAAGMKLFDWKVADGALHSVGPRTGRWRSSPGRFPLPETGLRSDG